MKIHLEYVAMLNVKGPASGSQFEVAVDATVLDLLNKLGILPHHQRSVSVFVNDSKVAHTRVLAEGDRVFLSIPISGG